MIILRIRLYGSKFHGKSDWWIVNAEVQYKRDEGSQPSNSYCFISTIRNSNGFISRILICIIFVSPFIWPRVCDCLLTAATGRTICVSRSSIS